MALKFQTPGGGVAVVKGDSLIVTPSSQRGGAGGFHDAAPAPRGSSNVGDIRSFSVDDVCRFIMSLGLDPVPFKTNAVEGADLLELRDEEFQEYLGLLPLQIRKIKKKIQEFVPQREVEEDSRWPAETEDDSTPSKGIFQRYQELVASSPAPSQGYGGHSSQDSYAPQSGGFQQGNGGKFSSTDHRDGNFEKPAIDYSQMKPCERGLVEGVHAEEGQEEAARNHDFEKQIFSNTSTGIDFDKYSEIPAEATGNNVPKPIDSFDSANFHKLLLENIQLAKYKNPTPVQRYGIAITLAGRDLMACAQTGSGKTAAFLFPVISSLLSRGTTRADLVNAELGGIRKMCFPDACIMCPTRELAVQIYDEALKFTYRSYLRPAVVYGGADPKGQVIQIKKGCHILIATPGRLNQMIERRHISLSKTFFLILDEADRMLDMGFEPQIRQIVDGTDLPKAGARQTMMFSATFPREVQVLASEFLHDYIFLTVGRVGAASATIQQIVEYTEEGDKHAKLIELLQTHKEGLTLVFVQTKKQSDTLEEFLKRQGFPATSLNGDRMQWEREEALENFKAGRTPVLVATDVAQRGLDIPHVNHVINFDMPANIDDYVHRIGRTGRVGNRGLATSFFNDQDTTLAPDLLVVLEEAKQNVPSWLKDCSNELMSGQSQARTRYKFGGRDIRPGQKGPGAGGKRDDFQQSFDSPSADVSTPAGGDIW